MSTFLLLLFLCDHVRFIFISPAFEKKSLLVTTPHYRHLIHLIVIGVWCIAKVLNKVEKRAKQNENVVHFTILRRTV